MRRPDPYCTVQFILFAVAAFCFTMMVVINYRYARTEQICLTQREVFIDGHRARFEPDGIYVGTTKVAALPRERECLYFNFRRLHPR